MLSPDQLLQKGRYRIIKPLTEIESEAFDSSSGINVLIREIHNGSAIIARHAAILTSLKHDSLLQVINFFSESGKSFLVYEKLEGNTFSELIEKNKKPFPLSAISNWAAQMLAAISYLHTQNPPLFYGNFNPQNVKIGLNDKIKLFPHNIVQHLAANGDTATGNQQFDALTLAFSPLEQIWKGLDSASQKVILNSFDERSEKILEQPFNAQSDIYSFGATLYYLATAKLPIDALSRSIEILEGKNDPLLPPEKLNPHIPREFSDFLMKSLEIKRENRFGSASMMLPILRTALANAGQRELNLMSGKGDENVLEIPPVEPGIKPPRQFIRQIENEQLSQIEIIKQQLREAEAKRLEAERRAAEAEKRLLEHESQTFNSQEFSAILDASAQNSPHISNSPAVENPDDDFDGLFLQPEKNNRSFVKVAVGAVVLLVLGGAGWGVWNLSNSNSLQTTQSSFNTTVPPVQKAENTPPPTPEPAVAVQTEETSNTEENPTVPASEESVKTETNPAAVKNRTAPQTTPPPPQTAKKQNPQPAKTAENKKKVTLDDLLKDN